MTSSSGRRGDVLSAKGSWGLGLLALVITALLLKSGWCSCTLFALNSWALLAGAVLLLGNRTFGVLASEKEKKTLDCLRLTQLSASQLFLHKLTPEFRSLARLLAAMAPATLLSGAFSASGWSGALLVLAVAALAGGLSIVLSLFVSSLASSTSRAVVQGWTLKLSWLLLTPVLDLVVSAVTVTTTRYPVFDALNPFAAVWPVVMPEAVGGLRQGLPLAFLVLGSLAGAAMWWVACRRYDNGMVAAPSLTDRHVHQIYRRTPTWVPNWFQLQDNPVFLRELASQLRSGAGRWPGYAVFVTLFLAPFLYSQSWNVRRSSEMQWNVSGQSQPAVVVSEKNPEVNLLASDGAGGAPFVRLHSYDGTELRLKGHTACACLRMTCYQKFGVPLPASKVVKIEYRSPLSLFSSTSEPESSHGPREVGLSKHEAVSYGISTSGGEAGQRRLSSTTLEQIRAHSMSQGLLGCVILLCLYLGIRCSGFLANAVTSESDRRSWNDLALTGLSPNQIVQGKLAGALLVPCIQLLVASPSLLFFVLAGALTPLAAVQLVVYAVALALTAGLVGFWASSSSPTSHQAQGLALATVLAWLVVVPVVGAAFGRALMIPLLFLGLSALQRNRLVAVGWLGLAGAVLLSPFSLSPWTCLPATVACGFGVGHCLLVSGLAFVGGLLALAGISALCLGGIQAGLSQPGQEDALRPDRLV